MHPTPPYPHPPQPRRMGAGTKIAIGCGGCAGALALGFGFLLVLGAILSTGDSADPEPAQAEQTAEQEAPQPEQEDSSDDEDLLLAYLDEQSDAVANVLDGDLSSDAQQRIDDIDAEYMYAPEPGHPDGDWVHPWSRPGDCVDHIGDEELCSAANRLRDTGADVGYYMSEPGADLDAWCERWYPDDPREFCEDEYEWWHEDHEDAVDEAYDAVGEARRLVEERS